MISYWREHRRRRWRLHLQARAHSQRLPYDTGCQGTASTPPVANGNAATTTPETASTPSPADPLQRIIVTDPAGLRLSLPLTDLVTFLGSGPECRWRFHDAGLLPRHSALFLLDGLLYGIDLHRAQCAPQTATGQWWTAATTVRAGRLTLRLASSPSSPQARTDRLGGLPLQIHWSVAGQTYVEPWQARVMLFGTSPWCAIRLFDPGVAPVQTALVRTAESLTLVNLVDNTWTRRHGKPVEWSSLDPGEEFQVGRTVFQVATVWAADATRRAEPQEAPQSTDRLLAR